MKKSFLIAAAMMIFSGVAQAERVAIRLGGQDISRGGRIGIKQELRSMGYNVNQFRLVGVELVAEGRGQVSLLMSNQEVDRKGLIQDGVQTRRGVYRLELNPIRNPRLQEGAWQIQTGPNANIVARRLVVDIELIRQTVQPGRPGRPGLTREELCYLDRYPDICQNSPRNYCLDPRAHFNDYGRGEGRVWGCR